MVCCMETANPCLLLALTAASGVSLSLSSRDRALLLCSQVSCSVARKLYAIAARHEAYLYIRTYQSNMSHGMHLPAALVLLLILSLIYVCEAATDAYISGIADMRSPTTGLVGNVLHTDSKDWARQDAGIGAGVDSYYEYLLKVCSVKRNWVSDKLLVMPVGTWLKSTLRVLKLQTWICKSSLLACFSQLVHFVNLAQQTSQYCWQSFVLLAAGYAVCSGGLLS